MFTNGNGFNVKEAEIYLGLKVLPFIFAVPKTPG